MEVYTRINDWMEKGYLLEKLVVDDLRDALGDLVETIECNTDQGLDAYKNDSGSGVDIRIKIKGFKYNLLIECKNINHDYYLTKGWFMRYHELRFPVNKKGGDNYILINTAQVGKDTKKYLNGRGLETWSLSEQVTKDNLKKIKAELITKYVKALLFRIKAIINKCHIHSIDNSIMYLVDTNIRHIYKVFNRIDKTKLIEMNEKTINGRLVDRKTAHYIEDKMLEGARLSNRIEPPHNVWV